MIIIDMNQISLASLMMHLNMNDNQLEMQNYIKTILNFRKNSKAIHYGQTLHYAPIEGVYLISRKKDDETVIYIVNKNKSSKELDLNRFNQLGVNNMIFVIFAPQLAMPT